jgi:hypothetical protein
MGERRLNAVGDFLSAARPAGSAESERDAAHGYG